MTIRAVEEAIRHARIVIAEWGPPVDYWREDQTRYAFIDPIVRALGWDTGDPKECYPEYPRPEGQANSRADYALLPKTGLRSGRSLDENGGTCLDQRRGMAALRC